MREQRNRFMPGSDPRSNELESASVQLGYGLPVVKEIQSFDPCTPRTPELDSFSLSISLKVNVL